MAAADARADVTKPAQRSGVACEQPALKGGQEIGVLQPNIHACTFTSTCQRHFTVL